MTVYPQVSVEDRLFIATPIPDHVRSKLREALGHYHEHVARMVPEERWYLVLLFLGAAPRDNHSLEALLEPLPQLYLPTITLTHIGRGHVSRGLWAYGQATELLNELRGALAERARRALPDERTFLTSTRTFTPHVRLGSLKKSFVSTALADTALAASFTLREATLFRRRTRNTSSHYQTEGTIVLGP